MVKVKFNNEFIKKYDNVVRSALLESGREYVAVAKTNIATVEHDVVFAKALKEHPIYSNDGVKTSGYHAGTKVGLVDSGDFLDSIDESPRDGIFAFSADGKKLYIGSDVEYAMDLEERFTEIEGKFGVLEGSLYEAMPYIRDSFITMFKKGL